MDQGSQKLDEGAMMPNVGTNEGLGTLESPPDTMHRLVKPRASLATCPNEVWDQILEHTVLRGGICGDKVKKLRPSDVARLFPNLRLNRALAARMVESLAQSVKDFSATNPGTPCPDSYWFRDIEEELKGISKITIHMTIKSLLVFEAIAKNPQLAPIIQTIKLKAYDFSTKLTKAIAFKDHLYGRWIHDGQTAKYRRKQEDKIGARGVRKQLEYEYGYYRRYLAEALQIMNNGMFGRVVTEALSKLPSVNTIVFIRHRHWGKVRDGSRMVIEKPTKITVSQNAVKPWHIAAVRNPIYWEPLLELLAAAAKYDRIDTLVLKNAVPDYSLVPKPKRDSAASFFSNVKHLSVTCLPDRYIPQEPGKPRSRYAIAKNGAVAEAAAWQSLLASSTKLVSFHLALGQGSFARGGIATTTANTILINLIMSAAAPSKFTQLHVENLKVDRALFRRFMLTKCQNVQTALFESMYTDHWVYTGYRHAMEPETQQLPRLTDAVESYNAGWPNYESVVLYYGPRAAQLEANGVMQIGRTTFRFADLGHESCSCYRGNHWH